MTLLSWQSVGRRRIPNISRTLQERISDGDALLEEVVEHRETQP